MKPIDFAAEQMILAPSGLLLWPQEKLAVVADLHLEKGSNFALRGQFLPPHDSFETLQLLKEALSHSNAEKVIFLGDSFHDEAGYSRLEKNALSLFQKLCHEYNIIFIVGNHDGAFIPPKTTGEYELKIKDIIFRHEADIQENNPEISGHYHPKCRLQLKGQKVSRACFLEDQKRMVLPAFGLFTGGLDVKNSAFEPLFPKSFHAHMLGKDKIYSLCSEKLNISRE